MKPAIEGILIFSLACRAHLERGHGGQGTIIRDILNDRKSGTAIGAVGKGITVPPISRVKEFGAAWPAGRDIRRDQDIPRLCLAFADFKPGESVEGNGMTLYLLNP
jgi:hypothetical protein